MKCESCSVTSDFLGPHGTVHGILQARILEWVAFLFPRGSSKPKDRTQVSHIAGGFFTSWATGKPKNTGVGSLSLLQRIFPTQESNGGLPHCGQILYQLSYQGSPGSVYKKTIFESSSCIFHLLSEHYLVPTFFLNLIVKNYFPNSGYCGNG